MMMKDNKKPEWAPKEDNQAFTSFVREGIKGGHDGTDFLVGEKEKKQEKKVPRRATLTVDDYVQGVLENNRTILARTITLVESNLPRHIEMAQKVLNKLLPNTGKSIRIGITGVPGVGKSTFIEAFGSLLCDAGHRVAVLAVDPSSSLTKGSILGDKTRMEKLTQNQNAFIRPSPSGGALGGVTRKSRETILVCEAAGYDVILVETVGVGQNEIAVRSMVDFFLLLMLTGAGDELQGLKKGVVEIADAILVNKSDGKNKISALTAVSEYKRILHVLQPATEGWESKAMACSALYEEGLNEVWEMIQSFIEITNLSGVYEERRKKQNVQWMESMVKEYLHTRFFSNEKVKAHKAMIEEEVISGKLSVTLAAQQLLDAYEEGE